MNTSIRTQRTYAVLGVGAVGGLYGGMLAKAGYPVHFLAKSDIHNLRTDGLKVDSIWGDFSLKELNVYATAAEMPKVDCVLVTWKATSNHQLASILPCVCHDETIVIMIQNGLDVERAASDLVGSQRVLGGVAFLCCNKVGPGHINHVDYGKIVMGRAADEASTGPGEWAGVSMAVRSAQASRSAERNDSRQGQQDPKAKTALTSMLSIVEDFRNAGIEVDFSDDLRQIRWKKLAWNIPFNGLSVALSADTSQIMQQPEARELAEQLMWEVLRSARACGVDIPDNHVRQNMEYTEKMVPYASSMLLDYQNQRPLELDAIFAAPIRAAKQAGYEPIRVEMLYQQLRFLDWKNRFADSP